MTDTEDIDQREIKKLLINLDEKLNSFSSILQNFGLDLITKLGKNESKLTMLTDKIETLAKATLDIKSFSPILNKLVDRQKNIENELDLLKSLIQKTVHVNTKGSLDNNIIERNESISHNFSLIKKQFDSLRGSLSTIQETEKAKMILSSITEDIFELTGGHRILYEISQIIKLLDEKAPLDDELKSILHEKIGFWMNKLS